MPALTGGTKLHLSDLPESSGATIRFVGGGMLAFLLTVTRSVGEFNWNGLDARILSAVTFIVSIYLLVDGKIRQVRKARREEEAEARRKDQEERAEEAIKQAQLNVQLDEINAKTRDAKIKELTAQNGALAAEIKLITARYDELKRDADDAMERRHKWARETGERLTAAEQRADELQVELEATKSRATDVKDKVNENVDAIGKIVHQGHLPITPPEPLSDSDEHKQVKPITNS